MFTKKEDTDYLKRSKNILNFSAPYPTHLLTNCDPISIFIPIKMPICKNTNM